MPLPSHIPTDVSFDAEVTIFELLRTGGRGPIIRFVTEDTEALVKAVDPRLFISEYGQKPLLEHLDVETVLEFLRDNEEMAEYWPEVVASITEAIEASRPKDNIVPGFSHPRPVTLEELKNTVT